MSEEQNEIQVPQSLAGRISSRHATLMSLSNLIDLINNPDFKEMSSDKTIRPVFLTQSAQITGEVETNPDDAFQITSRQVLEIGRNNLVKLEEDANGGEAYVLGNSAYIPLRNVTLVPYANPNTSFKYDTLYLFADDVIGFSFRDTE